MVGEFRCLYVGSETCLVDYIFRISNDEEVKKRNYDFLWFLGNKSYLSDEEISNLITIFSEG
jgi:hypothetical protein